MKYRVLIPALVGATFAIAGCENPTATELPEDLTPSFGVVPPKATPFTALMDITGPVPGFPNVINPGCVTFDTDGTAHFKKCIVLGSMTGDLVGSVTAELNGWQNMLLGSRVYGFGNLDVCHVDFGCGALSGPMKGDGPPGGQVMVRLNGHGTGDFHTMQIRVTAVERGNTEIFDMDGVIF
jgi:hypothetical protein